MITFKGVPVTVVIAGDRGHDFMLPHNRGTMPAKTSEALDALLTAQQAEQTISRKKGADRQAWQDASESTRAALADLYDRASSTTVSRRQHHEEAYAFAASKLARALGDAETAVQLLADHAGQYVHPVGVGIDPASRAKSIAGLRVLAQALDTFPPVPDLNA
jgi:hypothetical protein